MFRLFLLCFLGYFVAAQEPKRPVFAETFTTDIDVLFRNEKTEMDVTLYYDRPNNRASIDVLFQGERTRYIFQYDEDRLLTIQDNTCKASEIAAEESYLLFTVDPDTKKKTLAPAEESLFFKDSKYAGEGDTMEDLPIYIYKKKESVAMFGNRDCDIMHRFSKPEVTMSDCDMSNCDPRLLSILLQCKGDEDSLIDQRYFFYRFRNNIAAQEAFQVPAGMSCDGDKGKEFPSMPKFFCFNYDLYENLISDDQRDLTITARSVCYDSELDLIQVKNLENNVAGFIRIYDFKFGAGVLISPHIDKCEINAISQDFLTKGEASELPDDIYHPASESNAGYVGIRSYNEIMFHVWTSTLETSDVKEIKEFYFSQTGTDSKGNPILQLSHTVVYYYEGLDGQKKTTLRKVDYAPISQLYSGAADWSVFDMSSCFDKKNMKEIEIKMKASCVQSKCDKNPNFSTTDKGMVLQAKEVLYTKLVASTKMSVMRTNQLKVVAISENEITFRVNILDSMATINELVDPKTSPDMNELYKRIANSIKSGEISFELQSPENNLKFEVADFKEILNKDNDNDKDQNKNKEDNGVYYTPGSMAGLGIAMVLCGGLVGGIILYVYMRSKRR